MNLAGNRRVRRVLLPILARVNVGDITIRHHHTGDWIRLHSYRHRNYWYRGRRREAASVAMFRRLVQAGDVVLEAGGHVGYLSVFLADLVGPGGRVVVFEPGANNLPYLSRNVRARDNVHIVRAAVGSTDGKATFYLEDLTGQNNTLVKDYDVFEQNRNLAKSSREYRQVTVDLVTVDQWSSEAGCAVDWMKIDIEGAELDALKGATHVLEHDQPGLMVEVTRNHEVVAALLRSKGYVLFNDRGSLLEEGVTVGGNVFALHRLRHSRQLGGIMGT